jgi:hypothetical protein
MFPCSVDTNFRLKGRHQDTLDKSGGTQTKNAWEAVSFYKSVCHAFVYLDGRSSDFSIVISCSINIDEDDEVPALLIELDDGKNGVLEFKDAEMKSKL